MQADSVYVMGQGHRVCQDYARAGVVASYCGMGVEMAYGLVADGCSGSPDSDVGARLLILHAERRLRVGYSLDLDILGWGVEACRRESFQHLDPMALDATLLAIFGIEGGVRVNVIGDGVCAAVGLDGTLRSWEVEAPDGFPRYANYVNHAGRRAAVEAGVPWRVVGPDGLEFETADVRGWERPLLDATVVAVFSDGVRSFVDADRQPVPVAQVVGELMAFRGMAGAFVQRRVQGFLRAAAKRGWRHEDDLAMAAVHVGAP